MSEVYPNSFREAKLLPRQGASAAVPPQRGKRMCTATDLKPFSVTSIIADGSVVEGDMRHVHISPHLDDAVLCAGGLIHEQRWRGEDVEIWSILAGAPKGRALSELAREQHSLWGAASAARAVRMRRQEDKLAARVLGARTRHLDFLDCIYRMDENGHWLYADVFGEPHAADGRLAQAVSQKLSAMLRADDVLCCPLGIGRHVDHILVRRAVERLGRPITFVADVPYALREGGRMDDDTAELESEVQPISAGGLADWIRAASQYRSQIPVLFGSTGKLREALTGYLASGGGLRIWHFRPAGSASLAPEHES